MGVFIDLTGQKFGRLTVISRERGASRKTGHTRWNCMCSCGVKNVVQGIHLRNGHTQSCGCHRVETTTERRISHGSSRGGKATKTYGVWKGIRKRCNNPKEPKWPNYGGRGIMVCERWQKFENFLADMGEQPPGMSIERLDNNAGYSPDNCVWASPETQARNKRNTICITVCGNRKPLLVACQEHGISYNTVRHKSSISVIEAFLDVLDKKSAQAGTART